MNVGWGGPSGTATGRAGSPSYALPLDRTDRKRVRIAYRYARAAGASRMVTRELVHRMLNVGYWAGVRSHQ